MQLGCARLVGIIHVVAPLAFIFATLDIHTHLHPGFGQIAAGQVVPAMLGIVPFVASIVARLVVEASYLLLFAVVRVQCQLWRDQGFIASEISTLECNLREHRQGDRHWQDLRLRTERSALCVH